MNKTCTAEWLDNGITVCGKPAVSEFPDHGSHGPVILCETHARQHRTDCHKISCYERKLNEVVSQARAIYLLRRALVALNNGAKTCRKWARESEDGGWSTHQVLANREVSAQLATEADRIEDFFRDESISGS